MRVAAPLLLAALPLAGCASPEPAAAALEAAPRAVAADVDHPLEDRFARLALAGAVSDLRLVIA